MVWTADVKMLSFSSLEDAGEAKGITYSELLRQDLTTLGQCDGQTNACSQSGSSKRDFGRGAACQNGETTSINDELGTSQIYAKSTFHFVCKQSCEGEQKDEKNPIGAVRRSTSSICITTAKHSPSPLLQDAIDKDMIPVPKKKPRRAATSVLLPWHEEVIKGAQRRQSMSTAGSDWAKAVNRFIEKIDVEWELKRSPPTARSRRRLILTTQLMQQILPPLPARFLAANATDTHENITYIVANLALIDACSHICYNEDNPVDHLTSENMISGKLDSSEKDGVCSFSNMMEIFLQRFEKLENDFLRWENGYSTSDLRMECRDLEKYATIIRFARFHEQAEADEVENSIQTADFEVFPQRLATSLALPGKLPKGLRFLSL